MDNCADAALTILNTCGVKQVAFLGVSWGGFVGLRLALQAPDRLTALVLSNTSAERAPAINRLRDRILPLLIRTGLPKGIGRLIVRVLLAPATLKRDPELGQALARAINEFDKTGLALAVKAVLVDRSSVMHELARISAPTLVIAGELDHAIPAKYAERIAQESKERIWRRCATWRTSPAGRRPKLSHTWSRNFCRSSFKS